MKPEKTLNEKHIQRVFPPATQNFGETEYENIDAV